MHLHFCRPNPSYTGEETKCISTCLEQTPQMPARSQHESQHVLTKPIPGSTCVDQSHPIPARTENASLHVFTIPLSCLRGHKKHLNIFGPYSFHAREDKKCFLTCADQTPPMPGRK